MFHQDSEGFRSVPGIFKEVQGRFRRSQERFIGIPVDSKGLKGSQGTFQRVSGAGISGCSDEFSKDFRGVPENSRAEYAVSGVFQGVSGIF